MSTVSFSGPLDLGRSGPSGAEWGVPDPRVYSFQLIGKTGVNYVFGGSPGSIPTSIGRNENPDIIDIRGWLPESFTMSTTAQFQQKFGGGLPASQIGAGLGLAVGAGAGAVGGGLAAGPLGAVLGGAVGGGLGAIAGRRIGGAIGGLVQAAGDIVGIQPLIQAMTLQTWERSEPLTMSFPVLFDAKYDAEREVVAPLRALLRYVQPYNSGVFGLLKGPGPTFYDVLAQAVNGGSFGGEFLNLRIGRFLYIPQVIIKSVNVEWDSMMTRESKPISARVDITVETAFVPTRNDIDLYFLGGGNDAAFDNPLANAQDEATQQINRVFAQVGAGLARDPNPRQAGS